MSVLRPILIAGLVVTEVGLWQWRMVIVSRGSRASAMLLGTLGALLQITAISQVVTNVDDPFSIAAYAAGVGLGVLLGLLAGDRLTPGTVGVTIITSAKGAAAGLRARGWAAVAHSAHGEHGPVTVLFVAINRRHEEHLHRDAAQFAPHAFLSTDLRVRQTLSQHPKPDSTWRPDHGALRPRAVRSASLARRRPEVRPRPRPTTDARHRGPRMAMRAPSPFLPPQAYAPMVDAATAMDAAGTGPPGDLAD